MKNFAVLKEMKTVENSENIFRTTLVYNESIMQCHFSLKKGGAITLHHHEAVQTGDSYLFEKNEYHGNGILENSEVIECFSPVRPEYIDG